MAGPDDPTIPYQPSDGPSDPPDDPTPPIAPPPNEEPPVEPPPVDPPPMDPGDPTLVFGAPPVLPEPFPDEGSIPPPPPPIPPPPPPGGGLPPEPPDDLEEEGWWAQRTIGERWAIATGIILLGILIAVLFLPGDDDEIPVGTTPPLIGGTTTTGVGDTTTTEPGETTTTAGGETTTTTVGETTTTAAPGDTTTTTTAGGDTTTSSTSAPTTTEALPEFPSVSGSGPDTVAFVMPDDLGAAVEVTHDGTAPFVVRALDADGDEIAVLVERVGAYAGTVGVNLNSDDEPIASLEFIADGDWSAQATYVGDLDPATLGGASGSSDIVLRLEPATGGDEQFAFSHDGTREFRVIAYSADGNASDVIDEFGEFAGPGVIPAGTAVVTIQGDGNWTITSG